MRTGFLRSEPTGWIGCLASAIGSLWLTAAGCSAPPTAPVTPSATNPPARPDPEQAPAADAGDLPPVDTEVAPNKLLFFSRAIGDRNFAQSNPIDKTKVCGASAPFLGEMQDVSGPDDAHVRFEWAPVDRGELDSPARTVDQTPVWVWGHLTKFDPSDADIRFAHPFAGRDYDFELRVGDDSLRALSLDGSALLAGEIDEGLMPHNADDTAFPHCQAGSHDADPPPHLTETATDEDRRHFAEQEAAWEKKMLSDLWYVPRKDDEVLAVGSWILDCGHPSTLHTEVHPPSFLAFAHQSEGATVAHAFYNPYRTSQLYGDSSEPATQLGNIDRWSDPSSLTFPGHFFRELSKLPMAPGNCCSSRLEAHPLIDAIRVPSEVQFKVCAPSLRPPGAVLQTRISFVKRRSVEITTSPDEDKGCVEVVARIHPSAYRPAPLHPDRAEWTWQEIDHDFQAANDGRPFPPDEHGHVPAPGEFLRSKIEAKMNARIDQAASGWKAALAPIFRRIARSHLANNPWIDCYDAMRIHDRGATNQILPDDTQPFPFIGTVEVSWNPLPSTVLKADDDRGIFRAGIVDGDVWTPAGPTVTVPAGRIIRLRVDNTLGTAPIGRIKTTLSGPDTADFSLHHDRCTNQNLQISGSCELEIVFKPRPKAYGQHEAVLTLDGRAARTPLKLLLESTVRTPPHYGDRPEDIPVE